MEWLSDGVEVLIREIEARAGPGGTAAPAYDAVIVGSGYGGAVAASRLARAGLRVCVLERGREYLPGEFPNDLAQMPGHVRLERADQGSAIGYEDALFDLRLGADVTVLVGTALGGGSQINANVAMRPDPELFRAAHWPRELRAHSDPLREHYTRVERVLGVGPYPDTDPAHPTPAKLAQLERLRPHVEAFARKNWADGEHVPEVRFRRAPIAVTFAPPPGVVPARDGRFENPFGVRQQPCVHCGDCVSGCNYGAKNTLTTNYLPDARRHGARLFTGVKVLRIASRGARQPGAQVVFRRTAAGKNPDLQHSYRIEADTVVLAAGTLGSVEILQRSRDAGWPRLSPLLGKRFSGNGDGFACGYDQDEPVNGVGWGCTDQTARPSDARTHVGPTITGILDVRVGVAREKAMVIEEGAVPGALGHLFHEIITTGAVPAQLVRPRFRREDTDPLALSDAARDRSQLYLTMGHDDAGGELRLRNDRLIVDWPGAGEQAYARHQDEALKAIGALGGIHLQNPLWKPLPDEFTNVLSGPALKGALTIVHPLGGCVMGDDFATGVVNHEGAVFDGKTPTSTYPGLYVMDGSIVPGSLGANPFLTIAALAERNVARIVDRLVDPSGRERSIDFDAPRRCPQLPQAPTPPAPFRNARGREVALALHEKFTGTLTGGATGPLEVVLELHTEFEDLLKFLKDPAHLLAQAPGDGHCAGRITGVMRLLPDRVLEVDPARSSIVLLASRPVGRMRRLVTALATWLASRGKDEAPQWLARMLRGEGQGGTGLLTRAKQLLRVAAHSGERRYMKYEIALTGRDERGLATSYHLAGAKDVRYPADDTVCAALCTLARAIVAFFRRPVDPPADWGFFKRPNVWTSLLTLESTLMRDGGAVVGRGALKMDIVHLGENIPEIASTHNDAPNAFMAIASLLLFALRVILKQHVWSLRAPDYPSRIDTPQLIPGPVADLPAPEYHWVSAQKSEDEPDEKVPILLTRYRRPGEDVANPALGPLVLLPGFAQSARAFVLDAGQENLVQHFWRRGFDVWLLDYRTSTALPSVREPYTLDHVALHDIPAAVVRILEETGRTQLKAFAHCMGSAAFSMALLAGKLEGKVSRLVLSQVPPHVIGGKYSQARRELAAFMRDVLGIKSIKLAADDLRRPFENIADRFLATFPLDRDPADPKSADEHCPHEHDRRVPRPDIATCKRVTGVVGRLYHHRNLSPGTHALLDQCFGRGNLEAFAHISRFFDYERVVNADGQNVYVTDDNLRRMAFPIALLHGEDNVVFDAESSRRTWQELVRVNGNAARYEHMEIAGYCHFDCLVGKDAPEKVFPRVADFLAQPGEGAKEEPGEPAEQLVSLRAELPLVGPIVGSTRIDNDRPVLRVWMRVDDRPSYPALAGLTAVCDAAGTLLSGGVAAWTIQYVPIFDQVKGASPSDPFLGVTLPDVQSRRVYLDPQQDSLEPPLPPFGYEPVVVADIALPDANRDYTIRMLSLHAYISRGGEPPEDYRRDDFDMALVPLSEVVVDAPDAGAPIARILTRERLVPKLFEIGRLAEELFASFKRRLATTKSEAESTSGKTVSRLRRRVREFEQCEVRIPAARLAALASGGALRFMLASCRYPGTRIERKCTDAALAAASDLMDKPASGFAPAFGLMSGDQVYVDSTSAAFDTTTRIEKVGYRYVRAFGSPAFRKLAARLPLYMAMDDHEIDDNWTRERIDAAEPRAAREASALARVAIQQFAVYQWAHSPRTGGREGLWYQFQAAGFPFFVLDTRTQRCRLRRTFLDARQLEKLREWLLAQQEERGDQPKFVVSGSVFAPGRSVIGTRTAALYRIDGWDAYPESQRAVVEMLVEGRVTNVVFVAGDYHCASATRVSFRHEGKVVPGVQAYSIAAPALYAPYPFVNGVPDEFAATGELPLDPGARTGVLWHDRGAFAGPGFAQLGVAARNGSWEIRLDLYDLAGQHVWEWVPTGNG